MVAVSWIVGGSKINSEGMSSSAGGQIGGGTLGESGMVSNLVSNSTVVSRLGQISHSTVTSPKYLLSARAPTPKPNQETKARTCDILEPKGVPNYSSTFCMSLQ